MKVEFLFISEHKIYPYTFHDKSTTTTKQGVERKAWKRFERESVLMSLSELSSCEEFDLPPWYYIAATVMQVKPCVEEKIYNIKNKNQKMRTNKATMILFKETFHRGITFYSFLENEEFHRGMTYMSDQYWHGADVLLLNPLLSGDYKDNLLIGLRHPLFPLARLPREFQLHSEVKTEDHITNDLAASIENQLYTLR